MCEVRSGRWAALTIALVVGATGACGDGPEEVQTMPAAGFAASVGGVEVARSFTEKSSGVLMPVGPCAAGVMFEARGSGLATHIGRFDIDLSWCMDPTTGRITSGNAAVTAADGDRIVMTESGRAASPSELDFHLDIVAGTGRFDGASGELDVTAILGAAGTWSSTGTGWMTY